MKKGLSALFVLVYIGGFFAAVPNMEPAWSPWFMGLMSVVFAIAFTHLANGSRFIALSLVVVVTVVFPIAVLLFVVSPQDQSLGASVSSLVSNFREHGSLWGFELLSSVIGAALALLIAERMRSNSPVETDAHKSGARGSP
jgi:hypothetical protein